MLRAAGSGSGSGLPPNVVSPLTYGAVGNGVADDTTAVQTAVNTKCCYLPPGYTFKVTSPITIPNQGVLYGAGRQSFIKGSNITGGVIQIGDGGVTSINECIVRDFRIIGNATNAVKVNHASGVFIDTVHADADGGVTTPVWVDAYRFDVTMQSSLSRLQTNGSTIGGSVTFTASVGGATSGTLTASIANGQYNFKFSDGENRVVTITGGTSASWSTALLAGTITTAYYGSCFWVGGSFNGNMCDFWSTASNSGCAYAFYLQDDNSVGTSIGSTFNGLTAQGPKQGIYVGGNFGACVFNNFYNESVSSALQIGDFITSQRAQGITFNSPLIALTGGIGYAAGVHVSFGSSVVINAPYGQLFFGYADTFAPVTITRGGGDTTGSEARGVCVVNPSGVVISIALARPGYAYTATPSVSIGGSGSGATATATFGQVAAFTGNTSGTTLTVTSLTSGVVTPGQTLTGGTIAAGTYVTDFISGTGGNGTYKISASQTATCTGTSAITGLTLTAGGSGYGAGYAPILVGGTGSGLLINAPNAQPISATNFLPLWPLVCQDRNGTFGRAQCTFISDQDSFISNDGAGNNVPCVVTTQRAYAVPSNYALSSAYDFGNGCITYRKYTVPNYP